MLGLGQFSSLIRDKNEVSKFIDANVQKKNSVQSNLYSVINIITKKSLNFKFIYFQIQISKPMFLKKN
jgi:hypothetical protein